MTSPCWLGGCYAQLTPWILAKPGLVPCLIQLAIFALKETLKHLHFATVGEHGFAPRVARTGECTAVLHLPRFTHDHSTVLHLANAASSRSPLAALSAALFPLAVPHTSAESPNKCNCASPQCQAPSAESFVYPNFMVLGLNYGPIYGRSK